MSAPARVPAQGHLLIAGAWVPVLVGEADRARAVRPLLAAQLDALQQLAEVQAALLEFHRAQCSDVPLTSCDVCMGRC